MDKIISYGPKAREELVKGADFLADAVIRTLGPFGENAFIDKGNKITNDGVTVAKEIQISAETVMQDGLPGNEINNRGAVAAREAALKTNDIAGDGTSTAILLNKGIYGSFSAQLPKAGVQGGKRAADIVRQIEAERKDVTEKLIAMATPITTAEQLIDSATVSTEDRELGTLIGQAQWDLGPNGFLIVEETNDTTSSIEKVKGVRIDNGFGTSQIINKPDKGTLEVDEASILLTSLSMKTREDWETFMKNILEPALQSGVKQLVVVARAWTDETVKFCMANIQQAQKGEGGGIFVYPLSAPYVNMTERMKDLAAVTGGTFYDSENSDFTNMYISGLGKVQKVVAKRMEALITGVTDENTALRVTERTETLQKELDGEVSEFAKKQLAERIAQLQNGFAIVKVGSPSDMERKRLFDKCEDAVNAVRAALQEGVVPGAGLAYKTIAEGMSDDSLLKRPLLSLNEKIMSSAPKDFVVEDWVKDPVKVLRVALEQGCAAASTFATAGIVITDAKPKSLDALFRGRVNPNE